MTDQMQRKTFQGRISFKEDKPGEFSAVIATLNVKDKQGDLTLPGAFTTGEKVPIAHWGHGWGELPIGRGTIREDGEEALVDGAFFLSTDTGKEHYETVKGLGELQEWSYGYDILDSAMGQFEDEDVRFLKKLRVIEVSPVMVAAGVGTRTTTIKGKGEAQAIDLKDLLQEIHELTVELGEKHAQVAAKYAELDDSGGGNEGDGQDEAGGGGIPPAQGKSRTWAPRILAERTAIDMVEYGIGDKE